MHVPALVIWFSMLLKQIRVGDAYAHLSKLRFLLLPNGSTNVYERAWLGTLGLCPVRCFWIKKDFSCLGRRDMYIRSITPLSSVLGLCLLAQEAGVFWVLFIRLVIRESNHWVILKEDILSAVYNILQFCEWFLDRALVSTGASRCHDDKSHCLFVFYQSKHNAHMKSIKMNKTNKPKLKQHKSRPSSKPMWGEGWGDTIFLSPNQTSCFYLKPVSMPHSH